MNKQALSFALNGQPMRIHANPTLRLIDFLRDELGLTGTKEGCGAGECGACTVLVDNEAVNACLVLMGQLQDCDILTIEGLSAREEGSRLQKIFYENTAIQCGYCTPGMIMSARALLIHNPSPTEEEIKQALAGNICRCSGYAQILAAVKQAAWELGGDGHE